MLNKISETLGEVCKILLPIHEEFFIGNLYSTVAICTLGSIDLLKSFKNSDILENVGIIGRLLTENKGIDEIIRYVNKNKNIKTIIICGKDVWGHKAGHSLIQLHKNGIDSKKRIIGSQSPDPFLSAKKSEINYFQNEINLINLIGEINIKKISTYV